VERRILCRLKSNLGPDDGGYVYHVTPATASGVETVTAQWGEPLSGTARELLATQEFLVGHLADGATPSRQVQADANGAGHAWATIRRAADDLGVERDKIGMKGGRVWRLPPKLLNRGEDAQQKGVSTFGKDEHLRQSPEALAAIAGQAKVLTKSPKMLIKLFGHLQSKVSIFAIRCLTATRCRVSPKGRWNYEPCWPSGAGLQS
jgi:hypothetical protein